MKQLSIRRFLRAEYQLGEPFLVTHRGEPLAYWLPVDALDLELLTRIREALDAEQARPETGRD